MCIKHHKLVQTRKLLKYTCLFVLQKIYVIYFLRMSHKYHINKYWYHINVYFMHDQQILCFDLLAANPLVYPPASSPNNYQEAKVKRWQIWLGRTNSSMDIYSIGCVVSRVSMLFLSADSLHCFVLQHSYGQWLPLKPLTSCVALSRGQQWQWPVAPDPRPVVSSL